MRGDDARAVSDEAAPHALDLLKREALRARVGRVAHEIVQWIRGVACDPVPTVPNDGRLRFRVTDEITAMMAQRLRLVPMWANEV